MNSFSFEQAYERLEKIVEKMNSSSISLDEALQLYEEADGLISSCQKRLSEAEQKIEILLKNQGGATVVDESGRPVTEAFQPTRGAPLNV